MSWAWFWFATFALAFGSFTLISFVIAVRGTREIRELFEALEREKDQRRRARRGSQP